MAPHREGWGHTYVQALLDNNVRLFFRSPLPSSLGQTFLSPLAGLYSLYTSPHSRIKQRKHEVESSGIYTYVQASLINL